MSKTQYSGAFAVFENVIDALKRIYGKISDSDDKVIRAEYLKSLREAAALVNEIISQMQWNLLVLKRLLRDDPKAAQSWLSDWLTNDKIAYDKWCSDLHSVSICKSLNRVGGELRHIILKELLFKDHKELSDSIDAFYEGEYETAKVIRDSLLQLDGELSNPGRSVEQNLSSIVELSDELTRLQQLLGQEVLRSIRSL